MPSATHATLTAPNALIDTLRASGLGQRSHALALRVPFWVMTPKVNGGDHAR